MIDMKKTLAFTFLFALSGCAAPYSEEAAEENDAQRADRKTPSGDAPVFSAEGVTLEENTPDHAQGRFEREGVSVRFTIDRDRAADRRHLLITRASGEHVVESTLESGIDTSRFFDGRLTMVGKNNEEPKMTGDLEVLKELETLPDWQIVPQLKTSLGAAGVAADLISARSNIDGANIKPNVYGANSNTPYPDNIWNTLWSMQSVSFYSWGFWATTVVAMRSLSPDNYSAAEISVGPYQQKRWISGYGEQRYYFQWAGAFVKVTNNRVPLCNPYIWWQCSDVREEVLIK